MIPAWMDPDTNATGSSRCMHCGRWIEHRGRGVYWDADTDAGCRAAMGFGHRPETLPEDDPRAMAMEERR